MFNPFSDFFHPKAKLRQSISKSKEVFEKYYIFVCLQKLTKFSGPGGTFFAARFNGYAYVCELYSP
ncbi:hypothetical protein DDZ16_11475 [Marinilabilia rubra]|uniref:Uncharacterized protein n=1 Tax=Marinilabilia rubra TaxID=2162893 RepID=A0A2U2B817_9BACT|nr:hypothetical protein DDZ16_11475 [Marinilabilia rubra]